MSTPSPMAAEIIRQVQAQLPKTHATNGVRFLHDDKRENWVQVHFPVLRRNVVIEYVPGIDLYDVQVHDFTDAVDFETRTFTRIYADDLGKIMATPRPGKTTDLFIPETLQMHVQVTDWDDLPSA